MSTIATMALPAGARPAEMWQSVAACTRNWLREQALPAADTVLLLPFASLIAPARRALGQTASWLPRVHTVRTLAAALGPPLPRAAGELTGDGAIDRMAARQLLRGQAWAAAWMERDPRAFDAALQSMVRTAHQLRNAVAALHPREREAWWATARQQVAGGSGPGATQRLLLCTAIEWAAIGDALDTDRLFAHRPAAWVVLTLGGDDAFAQGLLHHAAAQGVPALALHADPSSPDPFDAASERCMFEIEIAADAEAEAMATACCIAGLVQDGAAPLALVAQDRALVRRVRALLERLRIDVVDETGWSLATTRAGAHAAAALRAARPNAGFDEWLDWLKADLGEAQAADVAALEKIWRGQRVEDRTLRARADALWQSERARLDAFALPRHRAMGQWLKAFDTLLFGAAQAAAWRDDAAGLQMRRALRLDSHRGIDAAWTAVSASTLGLDEFAAWVDATLEEATFVPPPPKRAAQVVITPLSRAIGRDFAAAVLPGADAQRLGPLGADASLLDESLRMALGMPDRAARQRRAELAFVQLLRLPRVVALRRHADADEQLPPSPWLERLRLARHARGAAPPVERAVQLPQRLVRSSATARPAPRAASDLPTSFSASAVEVLRQCPYRFFSRAVLRLSEHDELDDEADKRDAGRWLHATLERFHRARAAPRSAQEDIEQLVRSGHDALAALAREEGVSQEAMLPFSAGLEQLAERYVHWLRHDAAAGWSFQAAEVKVDATPMGEAVGLHLHGRIDRIDTRRGGVRLIDYKTKSRSALRTTVRQPLEDTQLAVYAALQLERHGDEGELEACYLALDDPDEVSAVLHPAVQDSARTLVRELGAERERIAAGAPLPALGEGRVCDTCEARGLCRRDHWPAADEETTGAR